jgi:hypothetical protein
MALSLWIMGFLIAKTVRVQKGTQSIRLVSNRNSSKVTLIITPSLRRVLIFQDKLRLVAPR